MTSVQAYKGNFNTPNQLENDLGKMKTKGQLFIKNFRGQTVTIDGSLLHLTIEELKEKIFKKEGIPVNQIKLIYAGKQFEDGRLVTDYGVENESTIHLVLRLPGGGDFGFDFNCLTKKKLGIVSEAAPIYRQILSGLNLTATCPNLQCEETQGKRVIIMLGMKENGKSFDIPSVIEKAECPMCHVNVSNTVKNLIFFDCHYRIKGNKLINGKFTPEGKFRDEGDTPPESENKFVTFEDGPDAHWSRLKVKVTKLQNTPA